MAGVVNIASSIVFLAMLAVLVRNKNTAAVIQAFGNIFTGSLKIAEGGGN